MIYGWKGEGCHLSDLTGAAWFRMGGWRVEGWFISVVAEYEAAYVTPGFCLRGRRIRPLSGKRGRRNHRAAKEAIQDGRALQAVTANGQGRFMHIDDRANVELEKLHMETQKLRAEKGKLKAEERKLKWEAALYPVAVGTGVLTAFVAAVGLFFKL